MAEDESADWSDGAWRTGDDESAALELEIERVIFLAELI